MFVHPARRLIAAIALLVALLATLVTAGQTIASPESPGVSADLSGVPQITYVRFERTSLDYLYAAYCVIASDSYALDWGQINADGSTAWSMHQENAALNGCLQGILFFSGVGDGEHLFITITGRGSSATSARFNLYPSSPHLLNQCSVQSDELSPLIRDPRYRWDTAAGVSCAFVDPAVVGVVPTPVPPTPVPPTPVPPTPVPHADVLNVPYVDQVYVQRQTEWGYWNHCGPASVAMVLAATRKETRDVFTDRQATLDLVSLVKPTGYGGSNWWLMLKVFQSRGLGVESFAPNFDRIRASILAGKPVIAAINPPDHYIVITGAAADGTLTINDPFGGYHWWPQNYGLWNSSGRNINTPATKGLGVKYAYSDLALVLTASVGGNAPVAPASTLALGAAGGTLSAARVQVTFPGSAVAQIQAVNATSVTLTPQLMPEQPVTSTVIPLEAFQLRASNADGDPADQHAQTFTVQVELDHDLVDHWGELDSQIGESSASSTSAQDLAKSLTLAAWDPTQSSWVVMPTTVDLASYRLSAQTDRFTDFVVLVQQSNTVYLPVVRR